MRFRLASVAFAAALGAVGAGAQEPGPVRESVEVTLVEVPVRVLDRSGEPVRGLTREDFSLTDEGRPQPIAGFDAIDLAERAEPVHSARLPPSARRRYLIVFDFSFARPKSVIAARRAAQSLVDGLGDDDLAAVATFSVEKGVRLLAAFSGDRAQLALAIETLGVEPGAGKADPLRLAYDATRLSVGAASVAGAGPGSQDGHATAGTGHARVMLNEHLKTLTSLNRARSDDYERGRVRALFQSLRSLGQTLDAIPGRKEILFLSEGFPSRYLTGEQETEDEKTWIVQGDFWKVDADKRFGNAPLRAELESMGEFLRRTDCVIHTVDISGLAAEEPDEGTGEPRVPRFAGNALFELADQTQGDALRNANDYSGQLQGLALRSSVVYVLAFRPDRREGEGHYHALKVRVAGSGRRVVARPGYFERSAFRKRTPLERNLLAADAIASEVPASDIPARVLAVPSLPHAREAPAAVSVLVEVPGPDFFTQESGERTALEIYVYAFDPGNRLGGFLAQSFGMDVARGRPALEAGGVRYFGQMQLPPGNYRFRTLVRNGNTGRTGFVVTPVHVPEYSDDGYLAPPVFLEAASPAWAAIRGKEDREPGPAPAAVSAPFSGLALENAGPAAAPHVAPGETARLGVASYRLGAADETFKVASQILAEDGRFLLPGTVTAAMRTGPDADGMRVFLLSFTAPPDLASGRYRLRIIVEASASGRARQSSAIFVVP